ncbi:MAG: cobaltochelatase subunit CobN, partial [archaeon]|nr:cobaltochelatase subunit CobN [archaeon]
PSLRESIASFHGFVLENLLKSPSDVLECGKTAGEVIDTVDSESCSFIRRIVDNGFDTDTCVGIASSLYPGSKDLVTVTRFICGFIRDAVEDTDDEIVNVLGALEGKYVPPGPSGCPGRGRADILPTGKNFYSIEPDGIPWNSSWDIGSSMAEQMVERYVSDYGIYPQNVGVVLWATDTMKTGGDDVAYILKLMGLRPVWDRYGGRVTGLEVIPLSELGRPRIDVTVRISGLFRDTFPIISDMIDEGVRTIASLDEGEENNYLAANLRRDTVEAVLAGVPLDDARRAASIRIFGDAPGQYGCGISGAVETGSWKTVDDLSDIYVAHGCYVYGKGLQGESRPDLFRKRLSVMDVTVKNHNTRAVDMLDMDDDFDMLGGMNSAVRSLRGKDAVSYMGDSSDMQNLKLRTTAEECAFIFRSKIDNPKWLNGLKKHGFAGAKELSKLFGFTLGWSATSDIVEDWMYTDLAERFVLDKETREWVKDVNPYAMMEMVKRLDEAYRRGFWDASDEMLESIGEVYLEFEERIEEITDR